MAEALRAEPNIEPTTDRERALDGADYAINMIQVGGYKPSTVIDFDIPKKYGLRQTIADTLGIGGIMNRPPSSWRCAGTWKDSAPRWCTSTTSTRWR